MQKRPKLTEQRFDQYAEDLKRWIVEAVSPFENDTPVKQKARIARAEHDALYFCKTYLPHYFTVEFAEVHEEWEDLTEIRDESVFLAAPREHAKSTFFTFGIPVRNICYVKRRFQLIISDTNDQATGFTLAIRCELEDNPRLRHDFGDLKSPYGRRSVTWKKNDFISNGVRTLARGQGEKVRGLKYGPYRSDYVSVDDFENDENVENPKLVTKGKRWLTRAVIGSLAAGYTFVMVGNLFHPKSVLSQFIAEKDEENKPLYVSRIYRAWIDYGKPGQRPLWPALWSPERLEKKRRQMSTVDFNAEMMNLTGAENSPFPEEWITYYEPEEIQNLKLHIATAVDPSAKSGENNDYKAIITVGKDRDKMIFYVRHAWIRHASPGKMFAAAYHQHDEYGGNTWIEDNMLEDFLHEAIQNYAREVGRYIPWMAVHHSTNKEARIIGTLSYLVEYGKLRFLKNHSDQNLLIEQLVYILNKNVNDDGPDALEEAVSVLQGSGNAVSLGRDPEKRERMSGARSGIRGQGSGIKGRLRAGNKGQGLGLRRAS